ncbi:MAG: carboxypeptidase-like regulatory domain-containing protein [Nitrospirae bacterium]|nr:carboxypeptidase-like regulatory domain-containing protein [Nitrospirota bacterium]
MSNKPVTFSVTRNDGTLDGGKRSAAVNTDPQGKAQVTLTLGSHAGSGENQVEATFPGNTGPPVTFVASGVIPGDPLNTSFSGIVLTNTNQPVPGATISIQGTTLITQTDSQGQFRLTGVPVGAIHLIMNLDSGYL